MDEAAGWIDLEGDGAPPTLRDILLEVGRFYAPFMLANDRAYRAGDKQFSAKLDGGRVSWTQPSFKYQVKCLTQLRTSFAALPSSSRNAVTQAIAGTGCESLFTVSPSKL